MLGHIAIAAMGGCFSQNPDTGAAEATYFPAEYVELHGSDMRKIVERPANTTDFAHGFTDSRFWVRGQSLETRTAGYPMLGLLGTGVFSPDYDRSWAALMWSPNNIVEYATSGQSEAVDSKQNPSQIWTFKKDAGANVSTAYSSTKNSTRETIYTAAALRSSTFSFALGFDSRVPSYRYWGDIIRNEFYDVHWRRIPMRSVENGGMALYEADAKQFIEY